MKATKYMIIGLMGVCACEMAFANITATTETTVQVAQPTDEAISTSIKDAIEHEPSLHSVNINISTLNRNVALIGRVNTDTQASKIIEIAESFPGVQSVNTKALEVVGSSQPLSDTYITAKVKGLFLRKNITEGAGVPLVALKVETKNGEVYLRGSVPDRVALVNAINLAKSVEGVTKVISSITINPEG